jgi:cell division protein FtsW
VIGLTAIAMFIAAGARWTHIAALAATGAAGLASLAYVRPYIQERLLTFLNPATDPLGAGYQIKQSLIAVGSGKWFGRGFGQSIQKFNFVPEPVGDSIFAIFAEEWGFFGSVVLIALFIAFALRGYKIAADAKNPFAQLLVVGLVTLIAVQSFVNIAAMIGILPLTGLPLIFVSHGGTALFVALASVGIILNVSRST